MNEEGETAMHIAATSGYLDIIELLIKENGDPNLSTCNGYIPLHLAIINNRCEIIKYLAPLSNISIRDNLVYIYLILFILLLGKKCIRYSSSNVKYRHFIINNKIISM